VRGKDQIKKSNNNNHRKTCYNLLQTAQNQELPIIVHLFSLSVSLPPPIQYHFSDIYFQFST
jgi:hypothetical protein